MLSFAAVAARIRSTPPRCGTTRLVCVDGPSGSGKTELARRLAAELDGPALVHMDDLYPGWDGLADAVELLRDAVVAPLAAGLPARYQRYDWVLGAYAERHDLGRPPVLLVEGVGSGARAVAGHAVLLVWVESPREVRFRRGIERDGEAYRPHWERWAAQEDAHFAAELTRDRADLRVDGTAPDPRGGLVLLP